MAADLTLLGAPRLAHTKVDGACVLAGLEDEAAVVVDLRTTTLLDCSAWGCAQVVGPAADFSPGIQTPVRQTAGGGAVFVLVPMTRGVACSICFCYRRLTGS